MIANFPTMNRKSKKANRVDIHALNFKVRKQWKAKSRNTPIKVIYPEKYNKKSWHGVKNSPKNRQKLRYYENATCCRDSITDTYTHSTVAMTGWWTHKKENFNCENCGPITLKHFKIQLQGILEFSENLFISIS